MPKSVRSSGPGFGCRLLGRRSGLVELLECLLVERSVLADGSWWSSQDDLRRLPIDV